MEAKNRILVSGGAGFIGSAVCRHLVLKLGCRVINIDKLTYAGNLSSLEPVVKSPQYRFERLDTADEERILGILAEEQVGAIIHLAAETHVDRSIDAPKAFVEANVLGTFGLLQAAVRYWRSLQGERQSLFRFHHVSTDEVFGDAEDPEGRELDRQYRPSSPYAATKAASDHLVRAWHRTYGLPVLLSHSANNYGPWQFPEKLIPLVLLNALQERPLPVYGTGENVRDWLFVDDHARALFTILSQGRVGRSYDVRGSAPRSNLTVVREICRLLDERRPRKGHRRYDELITFVADRPGHDRCYNTKTLDLEMELGWRPVETFASGLVRTVDWYLANSNWWDALRQQYAGARLGLSQTHPMAL